MNDSFYEDSTKKGLDQKSLIGNVLNNETDDSEDDLDSDMKMLEDVLDNDGDLENQNDGG